MIQIEHLVKIVDVPQGTKRIVIDVVEELIQSPGKTMLVINCYDGNNLLMDCNYYFGDDIFKDDWKPEITKKHENRK